MFESNTNGTKDSILSSYFLIKQCKNRSVNATEETRRDSKTIACLGIFVFCFAAQLEKLATKATSYDINYKSTDLCEIGSDECLFHSDPHGDRYEELLVRFFQLISRGRQQLNAGQFLAIGTPLFLSVSAKITTRSALKIFGVRQTRK